MPRYTIKKGYENTVFSQEGVRRISATEIESDHELNSSILTKVQDQTTPVQPAQTTATPPAAQTPTAPNPPSTIPQTASAPDGGVATPTAKQGSEN